MNVGNFHKFTSIFVVLGSRLYFLEHVFACLKTYALCLKTYALICRIRDVGNFHNFSRHIFSAYLK